ncbi:putative lactoylglutathione lyase [Helianthus annuus]|uniref:Lactoylglutathione lyase n=1 Tax=Helianthus annuus TaxID=4232 RepID=A0A251VGW0_HELAN|nr:putative lactoylglutathione lyase [Helianthus annuus]KAJ0604970.1 putative lactoylglutathione lyase [Helianthus annuus]KAJ0618985.1 putative lactoylglutathione lyase [Helianthus annuus]KAJ0777439.1 putative lactoylglutathione lyase [Helianthus annuus]KAJ0952040.1 putative lactoylglutathione lyase [Helianthus annuus]
MHETRITQQTYSANNSKDNNVNFQIKAQQTFFEIFYPRADNFPLHASTSDFMNGSVIMELLRSILEPDLGICNCYRVYKLAEDIKAKGGTITREPGPVIGGTSVIAFAEDPDGYLFELVERPPTPEPLCQVMLRVGDLDRSIKFYEKALGMKLCRKIDRPEQKYTLAMMGYAEELETTVLELRYNYGVTEYTKGMHMHR